MKIEINKIYNEDCLKTMARTPDNFVDLVVTSPPYANLRDYKGYSFDFESIAKELYRIMAKGGVVVWVVGDATENGTESCTSFKQALYFKEIGFNLHDTMIYHRTSPYPANIRYQQDFEYMFVLSKSVPKTFNPLKTIKTSKQARKASKTFRQKDGTTQKIDEKAIMRFKKATETDEKNMGNIWYIPAGFMKSTRDIIAFEHPAIFPEQLVAMHIESWSNTGELVYDPFMGSGTTAKMARLLNRNYIGSEISKEYCDIAEKRIAATTKPLF